MLDERGVHVPWPCEQDIGSGNCAVHNSWMLDHPQKSVLWAPWRYHPCAARSRLAVCCVWVYAAYWALPLTGARVPARQRGQACSGILFRLTLTCTVVLCLSGLSQNNQSSNHCSSATGVASITACMGVPGGCRGRFSAHMQSAKLGAT